MPEALQGMRLDDVEDALLPVVSRPARYQPLILGLSDHRPGRLEAVVAAPDLLEAAIMRPAILSLYRGLGAAEANADLAFLPWIDFEEELRRHDLPLFALSSRRPLQTFDLILIPLLGELTAAGVVELLDLGRVPLLATERGAGDPVVVGATFANPEPFADFFDAFLLGDPEASLGEVGRVVSRCRAARAPRAELHGALARVPGVYVPSLVPAVMDADGRLVAAPASGRIAAAYATEMPFPPMPLQPLVDVRDDVLGLEVQRGCPRRCRFCQPARVAGRVRELDPSSVLGAANHALRTSGWEELSLAGLMPTDWSQFGPGIEMLGRRLHGTGVALALEAASGERMTRSVLAELSRVRRTTLAFAPEAGSERLRRVIGKPLDEPALLSTVRDAAGLGWPSVKLHFIIGLPSETDEDLTAIADLCERVRQAGQRPGVRFAVQVAIHPFVPRAHTPFQWEEQLPLEEMHRRVKRLRGLLHRRPLRLRFWHPETAQLEALIARGDRRLAGVILAAYQAGARLDSWSELARPVLWWRALAEAGIDRARELGPRDPSFPLPWSHLALGEGEAHLAAEREAARRGELTPPRRIEISASPPEPAGLFRDTPLAGVGPTAEPGAGLGAGPDAEPGVALGAGLGAGPGIRTPAGTEAEASVVEVEGDAQRADLYGRGRARRRTSRLSSRRYRVRFAKTSPVRFISHLDVVRLLDRSLRRADVAVAYSTGFSRHPKLSFGPPLSVGMVGLDEYFDVELVDERPAEFVELMNAHLPDGIRVFEAVAILNKVQSLMSLIDHADYRIGFPPHVRRLLGDPDHDSLRASLDEAIRHFFSHDRAFVMQRGPDGERPVELTGGVRRLAVLAGDDAGPELDLALRIAGAGAVRPLDLAAFLAAHFQGENRLDPRLLRITRRRLYQVRGDRVITPLDAVAGDELVGARAEPDAAVGLVMSDGRPDVQRDRYQRRPGRDPYRHSRRW